MNFFNCRSTFGLLGYLFEPFSNAEAKKVYNLAYIVLGTGSPDYWIGLDSIGRGENSLHYKSNGSFKSHQLTSTDFDETPEDFVVTIQSSDGVLQDESINDMFYSICQYKFV